MKLRFTTPADIDGGIGRSVTGERWPFKFMKNPKEPHERKIKTSLKSPEVIKKIREVAKISHDKGAETLDSQPPGR